MKQLYDLEKIKKLLFDFYQVTNRQIAFFDENFNSIIKVPEERCEFCSKIRKSDKGKNACEKCDIETMEKASKGNLTKCRCHAGLIECCAPIRDEFGIVGYLMFGQLLSEENKKSQYYDCKSKSEKFFGSDFDKYFATLSYINEEKLNSFANIMVACIGYIHLEKMIDTAYKGTFEQMIYYIDRNISNNLTVEKIAEEMNLSTSSVFKIIKKNTDNSPSHLIAQRRIEHAKELLAETDLNITVISDRVGIHDYNYFSRIFKRETSLSPTQYRKNIKK